MRLVWSANPAVRPKLVSWAAQRCRRPFPCDCTPDDQRRRWIATRSERLPGNIIRLLPPAIGDCAFVRQARPLACQG